jgi:hypothetical protein
VRAWTVNSSGFKEVAHDGAERIREPAQNLSLASDLMSRKLFNRLFCFGYRCSLRATRLRGETIQPRITHHESRCSRALHAKKRGGVAAAFERLLAQPLTGGRRRPRLKMNRSA